MDAQHALHTAQSLLPLLWAGLRIVLGSVVTLLKESLALVLWLVHRLKH